MDDPVIVAVSVYFICLNKYKYIYFLSCVVLDVTTHETSDTWTKLTLNKRNRSGLLRVDS